MELLDAVDLSKTGDYRGGTDDQDTPPRLERQLHRISFERDHPAIVDGVELVTFTAAEDDTLPIDDEVHGQDHGAAVPSRPPDATDTHGCQECKAGISVEVVDGALPISWHPIALESTMPTGLGIGTGHTTEKPDPLLGSPLAAAALDWCGACC